MIAKAKKEEAFQWVGVRFINSNSNIVNDRIGIIYHYKVKKKIKLHLGQELVVRNHHGTSVVVVVKIGEVPEVGDPLHGSWKWISDKVAKL